MRPIVPIGWSSSRIGPGPLLETNRQKTERARSGRHARNSFKLKRIDFVRLEAAARRLGSSTFRAIIALSYVAFARVYDRYDILLGLELANRSDARAKQAVGFIARPLPMLLNLDPFDDYRRCCARNRQNTSSKLPSPTFSSRGDR